MRAYELLEATKKPTLEDFLTGPSHNMHVFFKSSKGIGIISYVRKGPRYINGVKFNKVIDRASTALTSNKLQMKMYKANDTMINSGAYREFDAHMLELAIKYGYDGIYVENVLNNKLTSVLIRYGYELIANLMPPSDWKKL